MPVDPTPRNVEIINEFTSRRNSRLNSITTTPAPIKPFVIIAKSAEIKHASSQGNEAPRAGPSSQKLSETKKLQRKKFVPTLSPQEAKIETKRTTKSETKRLTTQKPTIQTTTEAAKKSRQTKRNPKNYELDDHKDPSSYQLVTNYEQQQPKKAGPNKIQPLHISTGVFHKKHPKQNRKPHRVHKEKIKLEKLPPNPTKIPETDWFDNLGKYSFGIIHGEVFTEPPEYSQQRRATNEVVGETVVQAPPPLQPKMFKSSFRDPNFVQPVIVNDHLGNFLYKSEVHYPSYRNNLYPPVTTYGAHGIIIESPADQPSSKELPPPIVYKKATHPSKHPPKAHPTQATRTEKAPAPRTKDEPTRRPSEKGEGKNKPEDDEEDYEEEEEGESSEDYEDGADNDRYDGEAQGDEDEDDEEESDERDARSRYTYDSKERSRKKESDEFERAWDKYGYGKHHDDDSGSYESSESVPMPSRIKFYHEIKEEVTTPLRTTSEKPPPFTKRITKVVSGKLNNTQFHPKVPRKPHVEVKSQEEEKKSQRSDAAAVSDDLKYFQ